MVLFRVLIVISMLVSSLSIMPDSILRASKSYINLMYDLKNFYNASSVYIVCDNYSENKLHKFCKEPDGDRLRLNFDTRMLVKCYGDTTIREWYSVYSDKAVKMNDLMEWEPNTGLVITNQKSLYQRRCNVAGTIMRLSAVREHPNLMKSKTNEDGLAMFTKMMIELARHMNFTVQFISTENYYGSWNKSTKKWTGILGKLESGVIDIAASEITMTKERMDAFDFSSPLLLSRAELFIKEPGSTIVQWNSYLKAFDHSIWVSLIILIILSATLLTCIKVRLKKRYRLGNFLVENHLCVWGIYCQQGLSSFPESSSLRITYVSIFFSSVVLSAIYSASIISYLTIFSPTLPFDDLWSYVKDGSYKLIVVRDSDEYQMFTNSDDHIIKRMSNLMKKENDLPLDDVQAFEQVCRERVAYYSNDAMRRKVGDNILCKLISIGTGKVDNLAFALVKDNPFTEFINYNILRFQDNGIMQRVKKIYFKRMTESSKNYNAVSLWGIAPLLTILSFGLVLSVIILFIEKIYYRIMQLNVDDTINRAYLRK